MGSSSSGIAKLSQSLTAAVTRDETRSDRAVRRLASAVPDALLPGPIRRRAEAARFAAQVRQQNPRLKLVERGLDCGADPTAVFRAAGSTQVMDCAAVRGANVDGAFATKVLQGTIAAAARDPEAMELAMRMLTHTNRDLREGLDIAETADTLRVVLDHEPVTPQDVPRFIEYFAETSHHVEMLVANGFRALDICRNAQTEEARDAALARLMAEASPDLARQAGGAATGFASDVMGVNLSRCRTV